MAGIGLLVAWQEKARFIVAAVVFVVTKQYNGSADVTACAISSGRCAVVVVMVSYAGSSIARVLFLLLRTVLVMSLFPTTMA